MALYGRPQALRLDHGPALTAQVFVDWCDRNGIARLYIQPGKPVQNACIERFNRTFREEVLDAYLLVSTPEVQELSDAWRITYNEHRLKIVCVNRDLELIATIEALRLLGTKAEQVVRAFDELARAAAAELRTEVVLAQRNATLRGRIDHQAAVPNLIRPHVLVFVEEEDRHLGGIKQFVNLAAPPTLRLFCPAVITGLADPMRLVGKQQIEAHRLGMAKAPIPHDCTMPLLGLKWPERT